MKAPRFIRDFPIVTMTLVISQFLVLYLGVNYGREVNWANYSLYTQGILNGEWYRLVTCAWLHQNLAHFVGNWTWSLTIVLAVLIETRVGHFRFFLYYLFLVIGASLFWVAFGSPNHCIGSSGATLGIVTLAFIVLGEYYNKFNMYLKSFAILILGFFLYSEMYYIIVPNVLNRTANLVHVGGYVAGLIAGMDFLIYYYRKKSLVRSK